MLAQRDFLEKAGKSRKPSDDVLNQMLGKFEYIIL